MNQTFKAFTLNYDNCAKFLQTQCTITKGISNQLVKPFEQKTIKAIWDTGAEMSAISHDVVQKLGLIPVSKAKNYTAGGMVNVDIFVINIKSPSNIEFSMIPVTGNDLGDTDMLIGMDIISKGDFAITNVGGKTTFSFRIPSVETIDFVRYHS